MRFSFGKYVSSHKQEKSNLSTELNHLKERLKDVNREFEEANNDRVKLTEEIDKLKRNMQKIRSEKDSSQRNYTKEVNTNSSLFIIWKMM